MSLLPRTIPDAAQAQLRDELAAAGVGLGGTKPGTRVTLLATYRGTTWELTYLGHGTVWRATGPGHEHGTGVFTDDAADLITSATDAARPALTAASAPAGEPAAPRTYAGIAVPALVLQHWNEPLGDGWRLGVRTTLAAS